MGGSLSVRRLLAAYRRGIFPWFEPGEPVLWWTPDPRAVLIPEEFYCSRSLAKTLRQRRLKATLNRDFKGVMRACATVGDRQYNTWIGSDMVEAYQQLHQLGHAHSIEVYDLDDNLVGGLYGVCIGRVFFGESMFSLVRDASKVALANLVELSQNRGIVLIDCQQETAHLKSLGAKSIRRTDFEHLLARNVDHSDALDANDKDTTITQG